MQAKYEYTFTVLNDFFEEEYVTVYAYSDMQAYYLLEIEGFSLDNVVETTKFQLACG